MRPKGDWTVRGISRFLTCLLLTMWAFSSAGPIIGAAEERVIGAGTNREAFLAELEQIRDGYRKGQRPFKNMVVEGRLQPGNRHFSLMIQGNKRRWECELDGTMDEPVTVYRLVDGRNYYLFQGGDLGIGSLEDIDRKWYGGAATGDFYRFQMPLIRENHTMPVDAFCDWILGRLNKKPNGPAAMKRLDAIYSITKNDDAITISIDFQQAIPTGLGLNLELTVDPQRGYLMKTYVSDYRLGKIDPAGCRIRRFSAKHSELAPGVFFLSRGDVEYVTGGRLAESKTGETSTHSASVVVETVRFGDIDLDESNFDILSLPIPIEASVYDQRTKPPVQYESVIDIPSL